MIKKIIYTGALLGALAVILGAFGAHLLEDRFAGEQFNWWNTAQYYHSIHSLAILLLAALQPHVQIKWLNRGYWCFLLGISIFCGSLYLMGLIPNISWLGTITPIGGILLILGWITILLGIKKQSSNVEIEALDR